MTFNLVTLAIIVITIVAIAVAILQLP